MNQIFFTLYIYTENLIIIINFNLSEAYSISNLYQGLKMQFPKPQILIKPFFLVLDEPVVGDDRWETEKRANGVTCFCSFR